MTDQRPPDDETPAATPPPAPPPPPEDDEEAAAGGDGRIEGVSIVKELCESYQTYAMSIIVSRALPDVRDGLKPSQRRILVAMNDLNLSPRAKHRKCAKICGDTSGNYHPHGDQVVYPTLVRMAQDFSMRYPLIHGQGNFGSVDPDPPAAARYTEARMDSPAMEMLEDLEKETVDFQPNYDETRTEPQVLPSRFPNLIVNGSQGIAVGMATNLPPHNLQEVCRAMMKLMDNPDISIDELMQEVPGPDFPTGGKICGRSGIRKAYTTGRGRLTLRAKCEIVEKKSGTLIHITEIPYQQYVKPLIEKIVEAIRDERVVGVKGDGVRDLGSREGMLIEIALRPDADPNVVLNQLYKYTPLESTFSIINIALVNGRPRTLTLRELMQCHIDHRIDVIRRRTRYLLRMAEQRAHILQGLIIAVDNIDEVIQVIRNAPDVDQARARLVDRFQLSIRQAKAILEMQLRRLTGLERDKLKAEMEETLKMIMDYRDILANKPRVLSMIRDELNEMIEKYASPRRTLIEGEAADLADLDLIPEERMVVTISDQGYIKREPLISYRVQSRGGVGVIGQKTKEGDFTKYLFVCTTHQTLLCFSNDGKMYALPVYEIPQLGRAARGRALVNLLELKIDQNQTIVATLPIYEFKDDASVIMMSKQGYIKKTALSDYQNVRRSGIIAMGLNEGDELLNAKLVERGMDVVICTRLGQAIRFDEAVVRDMGRGARGLMGPRLREGDFVVSLNVGMPTRSILTVCEKGLCKRTEIEEYRKVGTARAGGVRNVLITDRNGPVVAALIVDNDDQIMVITTMGQTVRASISDVGLKGRATQGVALIRLREDDQVASVALIAKDPEFEATESAVREAVKLEEEQQAKRASGSGTAQPGSAVQPKTADGTPIPGAPAGSKPVDGPQKPPVSNTESSRLPVIDIGAGDAPPDLSDLDDLGDLDDDEK